jgi:hypothetical protein
MSKLAMLMRDPVKISLSTSTKLNNRIMKIDDRDTYIGSSFLNFDAVLVI